MPSVGIFSRLVGLTVQSMGISLNHKVAFQERGFGFNCIEQLRPNEVSRLHPTHKTNKATENHHIHFKSLLFNLLLCYNTAGKGILPNLNLSGFLSLFLFLSLSLMSIPPAGQVRMEGKLPKFSRSSVCFPT